MFKVLIWDYIGVSAQWLEKFADMKDIEVVATIKPKEHVPEIFLDKDAWNWMLIFELNLEDFFANIIRISKLPPEKVIYALDASSWLQHPKAAYTLLNSAEGDFIRRQLLFNELKNLNAFVTCTAEGISYVATAKDNMIMKTMFVNRVNWAANEMKIFHELVKRYYNIDDTTGYFLDLGANIGTTGIYFCKKFTPNLKLLAFEPDPENFKLLRTNLILNDMEDKTNAVNCGLGDKFDEMTMYRNLSNPGANSVFKCENNMPTTTIKIIPLDSYLAENKIAAQEVKYIWIDTEGFEPQVLLGAKNLLRENPAPLFMECNLRAWDNSGYFEDMMALLAENYSHFIYVQGDEKVYPLDALRTIERPNNPGGQIGDIFLIRRGTID